MAAHFEEVVVQAHLRQAQHVGPDRGDLLLQLGFGGHIGLLQQAYVAPETELEQQVAAIWADVLRLPQVGLNDNFFEVGGHSLLAIQITSRVQAELGLEVPLLEVFQTETLRAYVQAAATFRAGSAEDFDDLRDFLSELEAI